MSYEVRSGEAGFLVNGANAPRADAHLTRQSRLIDRYTLNVEPEHSVGPALGVAYVVSEARPSSTKVTCTGHRVPLYQRLTNN